MLPGAWSDRRQDGELVWPPALWNVQADTFAAFVKVLLLTAQRRDKVATMKWDDISDDTWTIVSAEREKGNVRLPPMALDIINAQPRVAGNPYVFAGRGSGPLNAYSQRKEELDAKLRNMPPWVLHDLRRTARSLLSRAGFALTFRNGSWATPSPASRASRPALLPRREGRRPEPAGGNPPAGNVVPMRSAISAP